MFLINKKLTTKSSKADQEGVDRFFSKKKTEKKQESSMPQPVIKSTGNEAVLRLDGLMKLPSEEVVCSNEEIKSKVFHDRCATKMSSKSENRINANLDKVR